MARACWYSGVIWRAAIPRDRSPSTTHRPENGAESVLTTRPPSGHLPAKTARWSTITQNYEGTSQIQRMVPDPAHGHGPAAPQEVKLGRWLAGFPVCRADKGAPDPKWGGPFSCPCCPIGAGYFPVVSGPRAESVLTPCLDCPVDTDPVVSGPRAESGLSAFLPTNVSE